MGKGAGRIIAGAVLIVAGAAVGIFTGQWQLGLSIASVGTGLIINKPRADVAERQGEVLENRANVDEGLPVIYGTTKVGGIFADIRVDTTSTDRKRLAVAMAWCHGSRDGSGITSIDEIWFEERKAISGTTIQAPFSTLATDGGGVRYLEFAHYLGSTAQTVDPRLTTLFPLEWPSTSRGRGVAYSRFEFWFNQDVYPSGLPTILAKIRGNKVYDPRDLTWKHSSNPALCIRDYLLSTIYGLGIPAANIEEQSFIDMANYCDELVNLPTAGTQKRFELNGWVDTRRSTEENLVALCSACRGQVVNEGDKWRLIIRRARAVSSFKINAQNTVEGTWQYVLPGSDSAANIIRVQYVDPSRNYSADTVQWPEPGVTNPYLTQDNNYERKLEIQLPLTDNRIRAQQIGMTMVRESREAIGVVVTLQEEALQCRVGDLVEVTYETPGWEDKPFDVAALLIQPDGQVRAVLVEYEPTVYDLDTQFPQPTIRDTDLPNPYSVAAPTSLVLTSLGQELTANDGGYIPRIRVTWNKSADPFVDYYEVQAKKSSDSQWDGWGRIPALSDAVLFLGPLTIENWDVRISAVNTLGVRSTWVSASHTVTAPDPRPQILSITLANAHGDVSHTDNHNDLAHGDAPHADDHTDGAHTDHTDHGDVHSDSGAHDDVAHDDTHTDLGDIDTDHSDTHSDSPHSDHSDGHADAHTDTNHVDTVHDDSHGDVGAVDTDHSDTHSDSGHNDHTDTALAHTDIAHVDLHTDAAHSDSAHSDGHTDSAHGDGAFGIGIAIQADTDSASVKAIARIHGDHTDGAHTDVTEPTVAEVRTAPYANGRNVVIELLDVATGSQIQMNPGDQVRVGAIAYSATNALGVEGPIAYASVSIFQASVAPVGTDMWWPT